MISEKSDLEGDRVKIGIITWFSGGNYGTNLQAIALQGYLRSIGHSVEIINFEIESHIREKKTFLQKVQRQPQKYVTKYAQKKYKKQIEFRYQKMKEEVKRNCIFTKRIVCEQDYIDICNTFDILICGSDQIWNPNWYHKFYYADYNEIKSRIISYAPSLGVNTIREEQTTKIKRSLSRFSAVSVREHRGANLLKPLSANEPVVVVDPTLLLDTKAWNTVFPIQNKCREKYVLSMFLTDNYAHWRAAKKYATDRGVRHIIIPYCGFSYFQNAEIKADAGIQDLLNLIRGAECVLTDSFHVTVFSLMYHKQFYTFERFKENAFSSQNERIRNILDIANSIERIIPYGTNYIQAKDDIEYNSVAKNLNVEIEKSKRFLREAIAGCK